MPPPPTTRAFFGFLSFLLQKDLVSRFTQKQFGLKNVFKSCTLDFKQKLFPRNKLKKYPIHAVKKWIDYGRIIEFLPNLRDFPISRDVGLGVGKRHITCSCRCEFPQDQKFQ